MATIIKASGPIRPANGSSFNFDDMTVRANSYLDTMRGQATQIIAKAQQDAEAIRRRAEEDGRQAAIRAAEQVIEERVGKQLATLLPAIQQATKQIAQSKDAWLTHWEQRAVHLAVRIAERVIHREIKRDPQITVAFVKEALELCSGSAELLVRMHPDDRTTLGAHVEALARAVARQGTAKVVSDETISPGGCRVETRFGAVDQRIEEQLNRMEEDLT